MSHSVDLRPPAAVDYDAVLGEVARKVAPVLGSGTVADYIPTLNSADPSAFGMAIAAVDGSLYGVGDWREPFSIQSISKVFTLALVLARGGEDLWRRVGKEPSGTPFDSLIQLEHDQGVPRNPFVNAGGIVVTDLLITLTVDAGEALCQLLRAETGNPNVSIEAAGALAEAEHGHRNAALAHLIASFGQLENPVDTVLYHYFRQCSIGVCCRDLALAGRFLARHGVRKDGASLLSRSEAKRINALMLTCGTYDEAGEVAYRAGVPAKSGVSGGMLAVIPNRCSICVWSPGLDAKGNSVAGIAALDAFTTLTGWSVF